MFAVFQWFHAALSCLTVSGWRMVVFPTRPTCLLILPVENGSAMCEFEIFLCVSDIQLVRCPRHQLR